MTQEQPKRTYVKVDALVWDRIREEYLGGETARVLEERYGPSRNTIYNRSRTEGWTKAGNPRERPPPAPEATREARSPREAATAAAGQAAHALATGRIRSAAEFARLAEVLARVAERLEPAGEAGGPAPHEEALELLKARVAELRRQREAEAVDAALPSPSPSGLSGGPTERPDWDSEIHAERDGPARSVGQPGSGAVGPRDKPEGDG